MKRKKKQASMTTIHEDLREVISLLKDIQRNQFFLLASADNRFALTTNVGQVQERLVSNALTEAGVCQCEHRAHGRIEFVGDISQSDQSRDSDKA